MDGAGRWRRWVPWAVWGLLAAAALVAWVLCPESMKNTVALWAGTPLAIIAIPLAFLSLRNSRSKPSGTLKVEVAEPIVIQASASPPPASRPVEVGRPPLRPPAFQPRTRYREQIDQLWAGTSTVVLHGDGGVGKSQLARECFASLSAKVRLWVEASSVDGIITAYATAFQRRADEIAADQPGVRPDESNAEAHAEAFRGWLHATDTPWLMVLDDLDVEPESLGAWWPSGSGQVLVTTRRNDVGYLTFYAPQDVIELGVYSTDEALSYVRERLTPHAIRLGPGFLDDAPALVAALGRHPVALNQATAVIIDEGKTAGAYLARFNDRTRTLGDLFAQRDLAYDRKTVAATWSIALDRASLHSPHATAMASLLSVVHPTMTPRCLFTTEVVRWHLARALDRDAESVVSADEADAALRVLERVAVVKMGPEPWDPVAVHALAQRAIRDMAPDGQRPAVVIMADAAMEVWPPKNLDLAVGPQLRAVSDHLYATDGQALVGVRAHEILRRTSVSLADSGTTRAAIARTERLLDDLGEALGENHIDTMRIRYDLAIRRGVVGHVDAAVRDLDQLVRVERDTLGDRHEETLKSIGQLARWRGNAGDYGGAVRGLEELLSVQRDSRSEAAFTTWHNLAFFLRKSGDFEGSIKEYEKLVASRIALLGKRDPKTLTSSHQLAWSYGVGGDAVRAVRTLEEVLVARREVLGAAHPGVLGTRHSLAHWRGEAGDIDWAVKELEKVLAARVEMHGPDDERTLRTGFRLARWRGVSGEKARAVRELEEVLSVQVLVLGEGSPDVLSTRHHLARWRGEAGDSVRAIRELEKVRVAYSSMLGADHPKTLTTRYELARWRGEAGDPVRAAQELDEVLTAQENVLNGEHPNIVATRQALAYWKSRANRSRRRSQPETIPGD